MVCTLIGGCTLKRGIVSGTHFRHVVITPRAMVENDAVVHLYIDGDGRPFVDRGTVAADPSARQTFALGLMQRDTNPRMLLGRPCYHGLATDPQCSYVWWTTRRYAEPVVDSMVTAAEGILQGRQVVLIGYSGGATLAMLMAPKMNNVIGIITVAGNLDVQAWGRHHGYTPLVGLDPSRRLEQTRSLPQRHFIAGRDARVPAKISRSLARRLPGGSLCEVPAFDHSCCWQRHWPGLLNQALTHDNCINVGKERIVTVRGTD